MVSKAKPRWALGFSESEGYRMILAMKESRVISKSVLLTKYCSIFDAVFRLSAGIEN
jgi:hypothetical protein